MRSLAIIILAALCSSTASKAAQATGTAGTISGTVVDPSGAVVAGANVRLTNAVTNYAQEAKTATDGTFRLVNVPHNQYHLEISAPGFVPFRQDVPVRTSVPIAVKAALTLSGETETVNVEASPDVLENVPAAHTDVNQ